MGDDGTDSRPVGRDAPTDARPNVLVIHSHDLGRRLGCYGRDVATPNLDRLAEEGVLFENHFATAPQCSPSRGSLWTGLHPHVNGMLGLEHTGWTVDDAVTTLPEHLAARGYETHVFGLQHVTNDPAAFGYTAVHSVDGLSTTIEPAYHERNRARTVADTVTEFLREPPAEPFFASIGFFEAHRAEEGDRHGFDEHRYDCPDPGEVAGLPYLPDRPGIRRDLAAMNGMIRAVDDAVGHIDDALADAGLADETLVLFTTEHGIAFPRAKGSCYDPGIEAALLARYPGVFDGGVRYDGLVSNVDVLPTVLDLVADEIPADIAGRSLRPLGVDDTLDGRDHVFAEITWHDRYEPVRAVRTPRFKYIRTFWYRPPVYLPTDVFASRAGREVREEFHAGIRPHEELYDLEADPHERENLADVDAYSDVRSDLEERLVGWMRETTDPILEGPVPPADYERFTVPPTDDPNSRRGHRDR